MELPAQQLGHSKCSRKDLVTARWLQARQAPVSAVNPVVAGCTICFDLRHPEWDLKTQHANGVNEMQINLLPDKWQTKYL